MYLCLIVLFKMIKVKHPDNECNISQNKLLETLPPESRENQALLFSYGNASYKYHALELEPTIQDYNEWIEGLDEPVKKGMQGLGFEKCKGVLSFTRYVREKNDIGMEEFLKNEMGNDYLKYLQILNLK